jgi:hypothetical protein
MMKKSILIASSSLVILSAAALAFRPEPAYEGSTFNEVVKIIKTTPQINFKNPNAESMRADLEHYQDAQGPALPHYGISFSIVDGALLTAAKRTISDRADIHPYFQKIVHSNGICLIGEWDMTESSPYSGYFARGAKGLFIGRASTAGADTVKGKERAFGFAGKIFPTLDPNEKVRTANFFTVDNLSGTLEEHFMHTSLTNEPKFTLDIPLRIVKFQFELADPIATFRPTYPVARLALAPGQSVVSPHWIMIRASQGAQNLNANDADFRDELSSRNYPNGMGFDVLASETTKDPQDLSAWLKLGVIRIEQTITSFGCDRQLHFAHPTLKDPE